MNTTPAELRVTSKRRDTTHECPSPTCNERVDRNRLACPKHWRRVPKALRDELWAGYNERMYGPRHREALVACLNFLKGES